jgi:hypothetical protein
MCRSNDAMLQIEGGAPGSLLLGWRKSCCNCAEGEAGFANDCMQGYVESRSDERLSR